MYSNQLNYQTWSFDLHKRLPVCGGANIRLRLELVASGIEIFVAGFPAWSALEIQLHQVLPGQHAQFQRTRWPLLRVEHQLVGTGCEQPGAAAQHLSLRRGHLIEDEILRVHVHRERDAVASRFRVDRHPLQEVLLADGIVNHALGRKAEGRFGRRGDGVGHHRSEGGSRRSGACRAADEEVV